MCNLSDGIYEYGEAKGISIGRVEGAIREAVRLYHDEFHLMPTEIISKIMSRFGLDKAVAERYVEETLNLQLV